MLCRGRGRNRIPRSRPYTHNQRRAVNRTGYTTRGRPICIIIRHRRRYYYYFRHDNANAIAPERPSRYAFAVSVIL